MLMKRFYLLSAAAIMGAAVMSGAGGMKLADCAVFRPGHRSDVKQAEEPSRRYLRGAALRGVDTEGMWRPGKVTMYDATGEPGEWLKTSEFTYTYNSRGNIEKEILENIDPDSDTPQWVVTSREYGDTDGYTLETVQSGDVLDRLENSSRIERAYDPRIPSLVVENIRYAWADGDWSVMAGVSYKREVKRNADGNVIQVIYKSLYKGEYEGVQRVDVAYGNDGKAVTITEFQLQYDEDDNEYWQEGYSLRDCDWEETDGQIFSVEYVFEGNNRIRSAKQYHKGNLVGSMEVTYAEGTEDFELTLKTDDGIVMTQKWTDLPYGGFENELSYTEEGAENDPDAYVERYVEREEYDILGNMTHASNVAYFGDEIEVMEWSQGESELNSDGIPVSLTMRSFIQEWDDYEDYDEDEDYGFRSHASRVLKDNAAEPPVAGEWEDVCKFEFSDLEHIVSSINEVTAAPATDTEAEYFTIDGRRVSAPASGLYIRRIGSRAEKVVIR